MKEHAKYSFQTLKKQPGISNLSAMIAYEHHEKYDGSGYPRGLKEDEIHILSQITSMTDMFDALTADRVYRRAFPVHEACEMISLAGNYYFNYKLIIPFLCNITPYPLWTIVELSNGCLGVVSSVQRGYPGKQKVKILMDQEKSL